MSRIGRMPVTVPAGVEVKVDGNKVTVKGPKGSLERSFHPDMIIKLEGNKILVSRPSEENLHKSLHGLTRTLLANMIKGVTEGYSKSLEISGTGYRATKQGKDLQLTVGLSHPVTIPGGKGIEFEVPTPTQITVKGIDNDLVGQVAATIRAVRKPDPYQAKGIKYAGEHIRRKAGKAGRA